MKRIITLFVSVILALNFAVAQGQQLKTFHHFQGKSDIEGLTYTGYEDEMGNITPHGSFIYKKGTVSATLNYKNGKLDGTGSYADTKPGMTCKVKYKDGRLVEINYRQEKYQYYLYNDAMSGKLTHGPIVLKCSQNEHGLPIGDFELTFIAPYENISIKGKFDNSGKATGFWTKEDNKKGFGDIGNKVYFEQGYCLGIEALGISLGQKYFVEKSISEQEIRDKGFYPKHDQLYIQYQTCSSSYDRDPKPQIGSMQKMLSDELHSIKYHIKRHAYFLELDDLEGIDFSNAFIEGMLWGHPINYMSAELYHKQKADLSQFKHDEDLKKYYILKVDGESRLYVPLEFEDEFNNLLIQKKNLEKDNAKKKISNKVIPIVKSRLENLLDPKSPYYQTPNVSQFRSIVNYKINNAEVSESLQDCEVYLTVGVGEKGKNEYVSYKTNMTLNYVGQEWIIDSKNSFVIKERVNNIWDSIANLKEKSMEIDQQLLSNKEYSTIIKSYKNENITYKNKENNPQKLFKYYTNALEIQKEYFKFIDLVKQINEVSNNIILTAKDENDIVKDYQNVSKTWNLNVTGKIADEVGRLKNSNYRNIQDSCLTFIELRKTITQNNTKIAGFSKSAPTIVKAYNTYMKGVDLAWNPELGRNQTVREIINTQDALLKALSQPNISDIDKTVKKSKAKNWEDVRKNIIR